ncbi:N-acetylornithine carbamoyltransferase [Xiashengella succiniciproducens]|jgi:N-succinyl-L-ornithine transcarbamylase|uniref:N-succinylornithine carbamoyltransferase n=1 Tax=Xiashengella succiniciproducens TaxID=2949635 RepID=A0A9J6ZQC6_9BACT|nr:N-acetylornithine carbamoyltransferase [Alkaliflexus sp. Ai-910]MDI9539302.1 N-acetylornithine carbamoyltransferase [Bacteroidota bacterium]URW80140.1 N-acetylornithine carbamoyltransferase [Alkaliflexus sp. Ai-910]HHU00044.1 N-acetylornithine carbamoyltransferase [Bacteroidales bacterium]
MRRFLTPEDLGDLRKALDEARYVKANPFADQDLGRNKTLLLIFFNSSLRTRLSSQRAATNMGMNVIVLDINKDGWKLESEYGVVMDGDKPEHIREAVPVMGQYADIIGVRSFADFVDRDKDYKEHILNQFIELSGRPVISLESATRHPLQAFADLITVEEYKTKPRPKVVMTWAPHPRALPQAVPNSFVEWMKKADVELVMTCPKGYELAPEFMEGLTYEPDQDKALAGADFVYAKNWSSYHEYGQILSKDRSWTVDENKMALTNNAKFMHCLPVRRNMIVSDEVIEGPNSIVIPEAANRVVSMQVVLKRMLQSMK